MGGWQPYRRIAVHGRYEEGTVNPKGLDCDRTLEAAETSCPAPKRPPLGTTPQGQKTQLTVPFIDAETKPAQRRPWVSAQKSGGRLATREPGRRDPTAA